MRLLVEFVSYNDLRREKAWFYHIENSRHNLVYLKIIGLQPLDKISWVSLTNKRQRNIIQPDIIQMSFIRLVQTGISNYLYKNIFVQRIIR